MNLDRSRILYGPANATASRSLVGRLQVAGLRVLARSGVKVRSKLLQPLVWAVGAGSRKRIDLTIPPGISLSVELGDPYWLSAAIDGEYEPELGAFFKSMPREATLFVDCGANVGWWSLVVEKSLGWRAVAVEACAALVRDIERNRAMNECSFQIRHAAIWNASGRTMTLRTGRAAHAGNHLAATSGYVAKWRQPGSEIVSTLTVDDVVKAHRRPGERVVIKLDVEGAEIAGFAGAQESLDAGATLIYNDHGLDAECRATAEVLEMGLLVSYPGKSGLQSIRSPGEARKLKTNPRIGYNFVAYRASRGANA